MVSNKSYLISLSNVVTCSLCQNFIDLTSFVIKFPFFITFITDKKVSGKSKDEQMAERKQELEKRLQDVSGVLGTAKKSTKKGAFLSQHQFSRFILTEIVYVLFYFFFHCR